MSNPVPTIGRIVHYRLSKEDAEAINKKRKEAEDFKGFSNGIQIHTGNVAMKEISFR